MLPLILVLLCQMASAEYRVYQLRLSRGPTMRMLLSTLDHIQYPEYYPLQSGERVEYVDSWMCYGRTGYFRPYCAKPQPKVKTEQKTSSAPLSAAPAR